jgi:VCBS repeat-containing protein
MAQVPPTAVEDEIFTYDNVNASGSLAENDLNPSGSELTYTFLSTTNHGDLILNPDGTWTFSPYPEVAAVNQAMQYEVCDQYGQCDVGLVMLYVQFQNNAPEAEDDVLFVEMNEPRFGDVSPNDFDPDYLSDPISTINSYAIYQAQFMPPKPYHGTVIMNLDGTFQYTPDPGFTGTDVFTYANCDACAVCDTAQVHITVLPSNDEPTAGNSEVLNLNEDAFLSGTVASLTSDPENDPLTHSVLFQPEHGTVIMNQDGTFIYTPDLDYVGADDFMYLVCDIVGQCVVGFVYLNVINLNDPPVTVPSNFVTNEDFPLFTGNASTGDTDDTETLNYSLIAQPNHGSASVNPNGSFTYSPEQNYHGADTLFLSVCDADGACTPDFIYFQISPLNDWPVALDDEFFGYEDEDLTGSLTNDFDVDGDALTYSVISAGQGGSIDINPDGTFLFDPNPNFSGFSYTTYQVCDQNNACDQATLILEIIEINDDPIINPDNFSGSEDNPVSGSVLTNDIEPDGEIIYFFTTSNPQHGTISFNDNGNFTYTPDDNWFGEDVINFYGCDPCAVCMSSTLTITIEPVNDVPVVSDAFYAVTEDASVNMNLGIYANDVDDLNLAFSVLSVAEHGSVTLDSEGNGVYTPDADYSGQDHFTYQVCDGQNACSQAEVTITVNPANDAPVATGSEFSTSEDTAIDNVLTGDYDIDGDALQYSLISEPLNGSVIVAQNGQFMYTPDLNYHGVDFFTYEVCDNSDACDAAIVQLNIAPVNDAPTASVFTNVTYQNETLTGDLSIFTVDPDGDAVSFEIISATSNGDISMESDGSYVYVPDLDFSGADAASVRVCDTYDVCIDVPLNITVFTTNTAPQASSVNESIEEDETITDNLASYVTDLEGGVLSFTVIDIPDNGTLLLLPDGSFTYTPNENYHGTDSFSFNVCDTGNMCDNGVVNIEIASVNDTPIVFNESVELAEDGTISGNVSLNDLDEDGDLLTYTLINGTSNGVLTFGSSGEYTFTPQANYFGSLIITYNVCDGNNACASGSINVTVNSVNDTPVSTSGATVINEDESYAGGLQALITDVDDINGHSFSPGTLPTHGTLSIMANGQFTYTPDSDFYGTDSFTFNACDDENACTSNMFNITVSSVNDIPLAQDDFRTINEDQFTNGNLGLNDSDADNDELTFTLLSQPVRGQLDIDAAGNFTYTPFDNESGNESLMIEVCDSYPACDTSYLYINIIPVNDAPEAYDFETTTDEDLLLIGDLVTSATDVDADELSFSLLGLPALGELLLDEQGEFVYTPFENIHGTDIISYSACDGQGACSEAQLIIIISPVNDAPQANGETIHVLEDSFEANSVAGNDNDPDNDELIFHLIEAPLFGDFELMPNGDFIYTPVINFWGDDEVIYEVCDAQGACSQAVLTLEVDFVNDAPILYDESVQVIMNQTVTGSVATNDVELDDEYLVYYIYDDNSNGIFTLNEDGTFQYTPYQNVYGVFTLTYYACDPCAVCDEGLITLYVVPEKDANTPPVVSAFETDICHGSVIDIEMLDLVQDNEEDASTLIIEFDEVDSGSISFDAETKVLTYQSDASNDLPVSISYTVCDNSLFQMCTEGQITINMLPDIVPVITDSLVTDILCFGQTNGSIDITVDGPPGMSYEWSNDEQSEDLNNVSAGEYSVTITGPGDCFINQTFNFVVEQPSAALQAAITSFTNINDLGNGSISIDITGGTAPYNVIWTGPSGYFSNEEDITDLIAQGTYAASITDSHGCSATISNGITDIETVDDLFTVRVIPNPFTSELNLILNAKSLDGAYYKVFDAAGQLVVSGNPGSLQTTLDLQDLASGCYWITVGNNAGERTLPIIRQ